MLLSTERSEVTKRNSIVFADGFMYHDLEKGDGRCALPGKMVLKCVKWISIHFLQLPSSLCNIWYCSLVTGHCTI